MWGENPTEYLNHNIWCLFNLSITKWQFLNFKLIFNYEDERYLKKIRKDSKKRGGEPASALQTASTPCYHQQINQTTLPQSLFSSAPINFTLSEIPVTESNDTLFKSVLQQVVVHFTFSHTLLCIDGYKNLF